MTDAPWLRRLANVLAAIWILGGALVFFGRFSAVFYRANQSAIEGVIRGLRGLITR